MDTRSELEQADTHMENERMEQPVMTASAVRPAQWPATDAASVAAERRRTARRQQRREDQIATGERNHRPFGGSASNRANARISEIPSILTFDSRAPPTRSLFFTPMPLAPQRPPVPNLWLLGELLRLLKQQIHGSSDHGQTTCPNMERPEGDRGQTESAGNLCSCYSQRRHRHWNSRENYH